MHGSKHKVDEALRETKVKWEKLPRLQMEPERGKPIAVVCFWIL